MDIAGQEQDINKPILTLKRKPKLPVTESTQDTAVVVKCHRAQAKPESVLLSTIKLMSQCQ